MAITLHRCSNIWVKFGGHPCWRCRRRSTRPGSTYEVDRMPGARKREETKRRTGETKYPWIEFEDGSIYREESKDMAQRIRDGKLNEAPRAQPPAA